MTASAEHGAPYADFVSAEVAAAQAMLDSIRDRAGRLLQMTLGALTALAATTGLSAGLRGDRATLLVLGAPAVCLALSALCLAVSAVCFLLVVRPVTHQRATTSTLAAMLADHWGDSARDSLHAIATSNLSTLEGLRASTKPLARSLTVGIVFLLVGVLLGFLAFAIAALS